jgi:hypothetical protein
MFRSSSYTQLFFFICITLFISGAHAVVDPYLYVDTRNDSSVMFGNVVSAGVATPTWNLNQAHENPGTPLPTFYLYLNGSVYPEAIYTVTGMFGSSIDLEITPTTPTLYNNGTLVPLVVRNKRCLVDDDTRHPVTLDIRAGTLGFTATNISFYRICKSPTLNLGTTPNGTDVYTGNTVQNIPFPTDTNQVGVTIYLWAHRSVPAYEDGNEVPYQISASSNDSSIAVPTFSAGLNNNATLNVGDNGFVDIYYSYGCLANQVGNVTFTMTVTYGYPSNITISWWKLCGPVDTSSPPPLQISGCHVTNMANHCIVFNNQTGVQPLWSGLGDDGYSYYQQPQKLSFTLEYLGGAAGGLDCKFAVVDQNPSVALTTTTQGDLLNLPQNQDYKLPLHPLCISTGLAKVQVALNCNTTQNGIPTNYTPVVYYYNFNCALPLIDVTTLPNHDVPNVLKNTALLPGSTAVSPSAVSDYKDAVFTFWLASSITHPQNFSELYIDMTLVRQPTHIQTTMDTSSLKNDVLDFYRPTFDLKVPVTFTCSKPEAGVVTFALSYGWQNTIEFYYQTGCQDYPQSGGGGGLSGVAIFFIVFFVLLFVFCLAGSLFNYYNRGKRGWPIIPGYETCQNCYDKAMGPNRYTPQMDYERTFKTNGGYGSYGTTSGDSYQSNL